MTVCVLCAKYEFGSMVIVTKSTTRQQQYTRVTKTCASVGNAVLTDSENSHKTCIFSKNVTSYHPPWEAMHKSRVIEWLCMETVSRGTKCRIFLSNLQQTFDPDVYNNKNCITSLSLTKCIASTFKTG